MAGKVFIDSERCKGCGLCVAVCPKQIMMISKKSNKHGYFPAETDNSECTGCAACAIMCPDAVIEVYNDDTTRIVETAESCKSNNPAMIQEKS
jgi:2-oxoglutarate ferredoxin oxidoreductase subunit delta